MQKVLFCLHAHGSVSDLGPEDTYVSHGMTDVDALCEGMVGLVLANATVGRVTVSQLKVFWTNARP